MAEPVADGGIRTGACLCGAVRFSARFAGGGVDACHCGMCRKWSGGVFLAAAAEDLAVEGEVGAYRSSDYGERVFCKTCGTSLFWRMQDGSSAHVAVSALDDLSGLTLAQEIFIDDKPAFYDFANPTRKLTGAEFAAMFEAGQEQAGG